MAWLAAWRESAESYTLRLSVLFLGFSGGGAVFEEVQLPAFFFGGEALLLRARASLFASRNSATPVILTAESHLQQGAERGEDDEEGGGQAGHFCGGRNRKKKTGVSLSVGSRTHVQNEN